MFKTDKITYSKSSSKTIYDVGNNKHLSLYILIVILFYFAHFFLIGNLFHITMYLLNALHGVSK